MLWCIKIKDKANCNTWPRCLIYHLAVTPYLVLNVHWARLLICPSERRRKKEERQRREKEERGRKENVREKTAEDVKNDGGGEKKERNREITEHFYDTERENMSHHPP